MNRSLRLLFLSLFVCITGQVYAQSGGIDGTVKDPKGETIPSASIIVMQGGIQKAITITDLDGHYEAKPLEPGNNYSVIFTNQGQKDTLTDIRVSPDEVTRVNYQFRPGGVLLKGGEKKAYRDPLIKPGGPDNVIGSEKIEKLVTVQTNDVAALSVGVYQQTQGGALNIGGGRTTGNLTIIDGVQYPAGSLSTTNLTRGSVDQIKVYSSGVPARYGDATGGVISVTTKGITPALHGAVNLEKSVDGYGNNQASFFLSGPLVSRYSDSTHKNKSPIIGFTLAGEVVYDKDQSPAYGGNYVLSDAAKSRIDANPLIPVAASTGGSTLGYATENVTMADLVHQKQRQNAQFLSGKLYPKIDYQINPNIGLVAGANFYGNKYNNYNRNTALFSSDDFSETQTFTGTGYVRFTQKFGRQGANRNAEFNAITNAFYTAQIDYKKELSITENPNFKENTFDYGYVGKFTENYAPVYQSSLDDSSGKTAIRLLGYTPTGVSFQRSELNPILANYTTDYYNYYGEGSASTLTQNAIAGGRGLRNGDYPQSPYSLFTNAGYTPGGWGKTNADQIALTVDASFDYKAKKESKTTHSIEFGLYYQQRNNSSYNVSGAGIWNIMRQLTNNVVNQQVNYANPHYVIGGKTYSLADVRAGLVTVSPNDTVKYDRLFNANRQGAFDKNLRAKLGVDTTAYINVDALDPSFFSLNMFSADELLNSGSALVSYSGYDYTGKLLTGQVNFNDFWTAKDAQGNYTRPVGAYRPNYLAGYLSDYIQFKKDVKFNIGVRIERFDNSTKVLKDPYSLYATKFAGSDNAAQNLLNGGKHPDNISSSYVPYVSGNGGTPAIIGYRNGDDWYDAYGRQIQDPTSLKTYTGGLDPVPLLQNATDNIQDSAFNPTNSFTDYKPVVNVMPRINFSFPINDKALFYAHYDVLVQRPTTGAFASPVDYYFITQNAQSIIGNPDLQPEKTIDYEVGFQQVLTNTSSVTLTAFYKERLDQIAVRPYLYAYPTTYYTYGNRDFSTTKGFTMSYDLRRIGNISMQLNYTLQFAEGTGSNANTGSNITTGILQNYIGAGLPNLRTPFALDYDSRHIINLNVDYRYLTGEGPVVGGRHIFENAGANITFFAHSGEPYTVYEFDQTLQTGQFTSHTILGTVNGSRLPWHYLMNLRVDKDFVVNFNRQDNKTKSLRKKNGGLGMTAYVSVQNLLNTRDVIGVYGYTGRAGDDGYLTSADGQIKVAQSVNPQAFIDQYSLRENDPSQLNTPRRINLGLNINF